MYTCYAGCMNKLSREKQAQIIHLLVEGNSLRGTSRLAGVDFNTVLYFLPKIGRACADYQRSVMKHLPCKRLQVDEMWAFCYAKSKNLTPEQRLDPAIGSVWTWVSICPDTKLVPTWYVGGRDMESAKAFMKDLASRLANRIQLSSDGFKAYREAVEDAFIFDVDFAQLVKLYDGKADEERKPSARYTGATKTPLIGHPDPIHISTSICERLNLTLRMGNRRLARKTNAFSKKIENHHHALSLQFMYYNFGRVHTTLRVTPAMEAGLTDHVWSLDEIVGLIPEPVAKKRGPYKPRLNKSVKNNLEHSSG